MQVQSLSWEDPLEEGMATHSSILAWEIPWTEEPGGLQSKGQQRVRHDWCDRAYSIQLSLNPSLLSNSRHPQTPRSFSLLNLGSYSVICAVHSHHPSPLTISLFHQPSHVSLHHTKYHKVCATNSVVGKKRPKAMPKCHTSIWNHSSNSLSDPKLCDHQALHVLQHPGKLSIFTNPTLFFFKLPLPAWGLLLSSRFLTEVHTYFTPKEEYPVNNINHVIKLLGLPSLKWPSQPTSLPLLPASPLLACTWKRCSHTISQYNTFLTLLED